MVVSVSPTVRAWAVTLAVASSLSACGGHESSARAERPPLTAEQARAALDAVDVPADGDYPGGHFDIGATIPGPAVETGGRLASSSWDVYYVLDDGAVGAWGEGVRVFGSTSQARTSADELATFWICQGPRTAVEGIETGSYDVVHATSCAEPGGGYRATVSAAQGAVTANLTVSGDSEAVVTTGLARVWASLSVTAQAVVARVS